MGQLPDTVLLNAASVQLVRRATGQGAVIYPDMLWHFEMRDPLAQKARDFVSGGMVIRAQKNSRAHDFAQSSMRLSLIHI